MPKNVEKKIIIINEKDEHNWSVKLERMNIQTMAFTLLFIFYIIFFFQTRMYGEIFKNIQLSIVDMLILSTIGKVFYIHQYWIETIIYKLYIVF